MPLPSLGPYGGAFTGGDSSTPCPTPPYVPSKGTPITVFPTGRTRRIKLRGTATLETHYKFSWARVTHTGPIEVFKQADSWIFINGLGAKFTISCYGDYADDTTSNDLWLVKYGIVEIPSLFLSSTDTNYDGVQEHHGPSAPYHQPIELDASYGIPWSAELDLIEFQYVYFMDEDVRGADGSPEYGGVATDDILPRATGTIFYETPYVGGHVIASLDLGEGHVVTIDHTFTNSSVGAFTWSYLCERELHTWVDGTTITSYCNAFLETGINSINLDDVSYSKAESSGPNSATCSWAPQQIVASNSTEMYTEGVGSNWDGAESWSYSATVAPTTFKYSGVARADAHAYPDSITSHVTTGNKSSNFSLNPGGGGLVVCNYTTLDPHPINVPKDVYSVNDTGDYVCRSYITGLGATNEPTQDWRMLWRGRQYSMWTVQQQSSLEVGGGSSSALHRTWGGSPGNWEGYRFLKLSLKVTDAGQINQDVTVLCTASPTKTYTVKGPDTVNVWQPIWVDLCAPDGPDWSYAPTAEWDSGYIPGNSNLGTGDDPDIDNHDTRYPVLGDGLPKWDPPAWGIGRITDLLVSGPGTLVTNGIYLAHSDVSGDVHQPTISLLPEFLGWEQTQESGEIIEASRGIVGDTNGRRSLILPVALRQLFTDAGGNLLWVYSYPTFDYIQAKLTATPGWTITSSYVPRTCDHWHSAGETGSDNYSGLILWWGGAGITWGNSLTASPEYWQDKLVAGGVSIPAQPLYDEVTVYPGCGEIWWAGDYCVNIPLRSGKIFRGAADGIVYKEYPKTNSTSVEVVLSDDILGPDGNDFPDPVGHYITELPHGPGMRDHTLTCNALTDSIAPLKPRRRHRVAFRFLTTVARKAVALALGKTRRHARAFDTSTTHLGWTWNAPPIAWDDKDTTHVLKNIRLAYVTRNATEILCAVYADGSTDTVYLANATDESGGYTVSHTLGAGDAGAIAVGPNNVFFAWRKDLSGTVHLKRFDAQDNQIGVEQTTDLTGLDADSGIAAVITVLGDGSMVARMLHTVGGVLIVKTSTDGVAFT